MCVGCVCAVVSALSAGVCARECVRTSDEWYVCVISVVSALSAGVGGVWRIEAGFFECVCVCVLRVCIVCLCVHVCMCVCLFVCLCVYQCYVCMI